MTWNPYLVARRALRFRRGQRKSSCIGGQIRINNNHWKLIYVSRTISSSQYETNLWSTHVNIVRLTEPIRRCVRWRKQVFKIEGFVCKRFLPPPPPPTTFVFLALVSFLTQPKPRIPIHGLSLLRNQTETLATQAILSLAKQISGFISLDWFYC